MKLIYFDWNIFTQLKDPKNEPFIGINKIIEEIKDTHYFPYSSPHLEDLKKGYKDEEPYISYTNKDLNLLSGICKDIFWYYDFRCNSLLARKGTPLNEFEPYKETEKSVVESINFDDLFSEMGNIDLTQLDLSKVDLGALGLTGKETNVDFKAIFTNTMKMALNQAMPNPLNNMPVDSPLKKPLENMFQLTGETNSLNDMMQGMARFVDENKVDPTTYKELRTGFKDTLKIPLDISNWRDNTWDKLDVYCTENMQKSFTDLIFDSLRQQKLEPNLVNLFTTAYSFLDLFSFNPEKLSKKNTTANMNNDALHVLMAGHCDIYVTNDANSRAKAKVLYDKFNLATEILTAEEFLTKFSQKP